MLWIAGLLPPTLVYYRQGTKQAFFLLPSFFFIPSIFLCAKEQEKGRACEGGYCIRTSKIAIQASTQLGLVIR